MKVVISNQSELPIYAQIREQIKEQILCGDITEGAVLPSIRQLARDLGVSVITTTRAYNELEKEGMIASVQGKGSIVLGGNSQRIQEQYLKKIEDSFQEAIDAASRIGLSEKELLIMLKNLLELR